MLRKTLGIFLITLLLAIAAIIVYLFTLQPKIEGNIVNSFLTSDTEVFFDDFGIPHIYADNAPDAYFALGYVHAQDRLFQMELMRRVGDGRLSEVLGSDMIEADILFRTIGINKLADRDIAILDGDSLQPYLKVVDAYLSGINAFIEEGFTPIEFTLAGIPKTRFNRRDLLLISGYMSFSFAFALRQEPIVEFLKNLDVKYLEDFQFGNDIPFSSCFTKNLEDNALTSLSPGEVLDGLPVPVFQGSNSWAVSGSRSANGKVLFANDTHIKFQQPSVWYEAHINYPGFDFYGHYLAGIPFGLLGHSTKHAWGLTILENDDMDLYHEKWLDMDKRIMMGPDSSHVEVSQYEERIQIKGEKDTVITISMVDNRPFINSMLKDEYPGPVSLYWTYRQFPNHLMKAFYAMEHAENSSDFKNALEFIHAPGLNIIYGDADGNIAQWSAAKLKKRNPNVNSAEFLEGWNPEHFSNEYFDFKDNPHCENPPSGMVIASNQQIFNDVVGDYPGYYAPSTRAHRINKLFSRNEKYTMEEMKSIILDNTSDAEADLAHFLCELLPSIPDEPLSNKAKDVLKEWKGGHGITEKAPLIYYILTGKIGTLMMQDELGEEKLNVFLSSHLYKRSFSKMFKNESSLWWDDIKTKEIIETRKDIIDIAWQQTMEYLKDNNLISDENWDWGKHHQLFFEHPLGKVPIIKSFFNVGPFEAPGGNETINNAGFPLDGSGNFTPTYGPQVRRLIDFGNIRSSLNVLPTGNSGNYFSPHYSNQAEMFSKGEFRKQMMNKSEIMESAGKRVLVFRKKEK